MLSLFSRAGNRNFLVVVDTALTAGTSVLLLLGAARSMSPRELSDFSLVQLLVVTGVMLQRAFFMSPALASQRQTGKSSIPIRWVASLSVPIAIALGLFIFTTVGSQNGPSLEWLVLGAGLSAAALVQDTCRFALLSRDNVAGAVASDALLLFLISGTLIFRDHVNTASSLTIYWAISGTIAVAVAFLFLGVRRNSDTRTTTVSQTWRLGKWSGLDALMSAAANLTPMLLTALVLGSEQAGTYRVLQSSLGPLNILSTSLVTMFGLDSWKFVSRRNLRTLRRTVFRAIIAMSAFAVIYIAFAEYAVVVISGLTSSDLLRIAVIVGAVGIMGAATSPLSAASLALGYQRHGAILRIVIVVFSVGVSFAGALGLWLPWHDPIGAVTLFAATAGLVGWTISFRRAMNVELAPVSRARRGKGSTVGRRSASVAQSENLPPDLALARQAGSPESVPLPPTSRTIQR